MDDNEKNEELCRLCGEMSRSPNKLFTTNSSEMDELVKNILGYLGIQFIDNGIMPTWLCCACYFEAVSADSFMKRVILGQEKLVQLVEQTKTAEADVKEPIQDVVDLQTLSTDINKRGRIRRQTTKKYQYVINKDSNYKNTTNTNSLRKRTNKADVPSENSAEEDLLPSFISDTTEFRAYSSSPREPFAELRGADGKTFAALIVADKNSGINIFSKTSTVNLICEFCKEIFSNRTFLMHLPTHNNCAYECTDCLQSFQNNTDFTKHQKETNHQGMGIVENSSRNVNTEDFEAMDESTNWIIEPKIITLLNNNTEITNIDSDMTENVENYGTMTTPTASDTKRLKEKGLAYHCLKCEKAFSTHITVLRHFNYVHIGVRRYECDQCPATFKHQTNYSYHMAKHTGHRKHKCSVCFKAFRIKCELDLHMRTHTGDKPYKCEYCGKGFAHRSNMVTHTRLHTGQQPFKCDKCGSIFNSSSHWKTHKAGHLKQELEKLKKGEEEKNDHETAANISGKESTELEKSSTSLLNKKSSENQVEMIPPIQNSIVQTMSQNVTQNEISQLHGASSEVRVPPGLKFQCTTCLQYFKNKSSLTRHQLIHSREKPYKCPTCPRTFADPSNFKRHKLKHKAATEEIQNVSAQLNQQRLSQKHSYSYFSPTHCVVSDLDPDGIADIGINVLEAITNSVNEFNDDSSFLDMDLMQLENPDIISDFSEPSINLASKVVCISYPDPDNPNDSNVSTFFVPN